MVLLVLLLLTRCPPFDWQLTLTLLLLLLSM
jgi:hypothetical protein